MVIFQIVLFFPTEDLNLVTFKLGKNLRGHLKEELVIGLSKVFKIILYRCLSIALPPVLAAVDNCHGSAGEFVHTLHKGQEQGAPGQKSKVNPVTPMHYRLRGSMGFEKHKKRTKVDTYFSFNIPTKQDILHFLHFLKTNVAKIKANVKKG